MNLDHLTDEEKIFVLKDALVQAQRTVEFLHNCLVNPDNGEMKGGYSYGYPEQTLRLMEDWAKLAPPNPLCHHSIKKPGCEACELLHKHYLRYQEIKRKC